MMSHTTMTLFLFHFSTNGPMSVPKSREGRLEMIKSTIIFPGLFITATMYQASAIT